ncbi:Uncharacterised protein [uncultured archaeon]|nr:Uncharacterised protein [uncultured archaeon]
MGFIRGFFLVLVSVLLFLSIFSAISFGILSASLNYDNVQNKSVSIAHDFLQKNGNLTSAISSNYPYIQMYCQNNSNYIFGAEGYTFNVSCANAMKGQSEFIDEGIKNLVHQIYYTQYNCNFLDCFKSNEIPVFLLSEHTHDFLGGKSRLFLLISFLLFIPLFLLTKKKENSSILLGIFLIISSLFFIKIDLFFNNSSNKMIVQFLNLFFSQSFPIALGILIAGIVLLAFGIIFKIFNLGLSISNWVSKIKEKQVGAQKTKTSPVSQKSVKTPQKKKSK